MINTYRVNRKVRSAYEKNQLVFLLSKIPLLGDLITNKLYSSKGVKVFLNIINFIKSLFGLFVGKLFYLFIVIGISGAAYGQMINEKINKPQITGKLFIVLIFLAVAGGFLNNQITSVMSETYSSIMILRMDAKKYALSNYIAFLIRHFIGSVIASVIVCFVVGYYPVYMILFYPLYTIMIKVICAFFSLKIQGENINKDNLVGFSSSITLGVTTVSVVAAFAGFIFLNPPAIILVIATVVALPFMIIAWKKLFEFNDYKYLYKKLLFDSEFSGEKNLANKTEIQNYSKMLDTNIAFETKSGAATSNKKGYEYFNDIFIKRHRSIYFKHCLICSLILFVTFAALSVGGVVVQNDRFFRLMRKLVEEHICGFLFVLYFVNRGETYTKAYFYNCDCSMLTYNFYRKKETVISLFMIRLKSIIKYNMIPTIIIAIGVDVLYFIASGGKTIFYMITPISILAMGIFFSVHYLFLYYYLQPYNEKLENKSVTYGICTSMTYMACYIIYDKKISSLLFCPIIIGLTILYVVMAYFVINSFGYKKFKLNS